MACVMALFIVAGTAMAQDPTISIYLNRSSGVIGQDSVELSVSAANYGPTINVDVHFAIVVPNGTIYEIPGWATDLTPLFSNLTLPNGFSYGPAVLGVYGVGDFPLDAAGDYLFAAAYAHPGTTNFIGDMSFAWFAVSDGGSSEGSFGNVSIDWDEYYSSFTGSWQTSISAGAGFAEYFETRRPAALADEGCEVHTTDWDDGSGIGDLRWLDAGEKIDMKGTPLGDVELHKSTMMNMIAYGQDDELQLGHYEAGNSYNFVGYGGPDVGSFDVSVIAPEKIQLHEPQLNTTPTIYRSQDLDVRWNGTGSGELYVSITVLIIDEQTFMPTSVVTCSCVFDDDGEATIPSSILGQMPASSGFYGMYMPDFSAFRRNQEAFDADGLTSGGAASATSGASGDVILE